MSRRADGVAQTLVEAGLGHQDKVAQYLYNCPEYMESVWACFKAGLAPVNTNYRYKDEELVYLWSNADVSVVVFHARFTETIERIRAAVPLVKLWLCVDDGSGTCPPWATPYDDAASRPAPIGMRAPWGRSSDDIYLQYTGGTTGMPKGVMWRQGDIADYLSATGPELAPTDVSTPVHLPACPLMHGTGFVTTLRAMSSGGCVVTLLGTRFDVVELLDAIEAERVSTLVIVGDAFGKPLLRALDNEPTRWDISSLRQIASSGVMWSSQTKEGLLSHHPKMVLIDSLGSAEAMGIASSTVTSDSASATGQFRVSDNARVITDDGRFVEPGSGETGRLAVSGAIPIGYYKDEAKTAETFRVIAGERWSIPGDYATVGADGTVTFLGRGSTCINTGGEKVFPEEVEEALKAHPSVLDAVVVGVPDDRFGETVHAVVECDPNTRLDEASLIGHVKERLAGYKAPKSILSVPSIERAANGKVNYARWKAYAQEPARHPEPRI
jgi:acyl-CoA synthetase (AMP-forming)/AMP-acid ligase II